jgi:hypothetical protein
MIIQVLWISVLELFQSSKMVFQGSSVDLRWSRDDMEYAEDDFPHQYYQGGEKDAKQSYRGQSRRNQKRQKLNKVGMVTGSLFLDDP